LEAFQLEKGTNEETPGLYIIMATSAETNQLVKYSDFSQK